MLQLKTEVHKPVTQQELVENIIAESNSEQAWDKLDPISQKGFGEVIIKGAQVASDAVITPKEN